MTLHWPMVANSARWRPVQVPPAPRARISAPCRAKKGLRPDGRGRMGVDQTADGSGRACGSPRAPLAPKAHRMRRPSARRQGRQETNPSASAFRMSGTAQASRSRRDVRRSRRTAKVVPRSRSRACASVAPVVATARQAAADLCDHCVDLRVRPMVRTCAGSPEQLARLFGDGLVSRPSRFRLEFGA